jgi:nucleotide-binding universal stress UspA family protein
MRMLLAIEESEFPQNVLDMLMRQVKSDHAEVYILHVIVPPDFYGSLYDFVPVDQVKAAREKAAERAQELVARAEAVLRAGGFTVHTMVETGDPREVIIDAAGKRQCELIVVGTHGRRGLDRLFMGSVAEFVVRAAPCSVQVVRVPRRATARQPRKT